MIKKLITLVVFSFVFSLTSCKVSKEYVQYISKKEDITASSSKKVLVFASDSINVKEFTKTFRKNYANKSDFTAKFLNDFKSQIGINDVFAGVYVDTESNKYVDLNIVDEDYVIYFSNIEIANRVEWTSGAMNMNGVGGMATSTSVEYCVISVKVEVYDAKTEKEILDFVAIGENAVFLFNFTKTLEKTKNVAIKHIVNYLKSGRTTYDKY